MSILQRTLIIAREERISGTSINCDCAPQKYFGEAKSGSSSRKTCQIGAIKMQGLSLFGLSIRRETKTHPGNGRTNCCQNGSHMFDNPPPRVSHSCLTSPYRIRAKSCFSPYLRQRAPLFFCFCGGSGVLWCRLQKCYFLTRRSGFRTSQIQHSFPRHLHRMCPFRVKRSGSASSGSCIFRRSGWPTRASTTKRGLISSRYSSRRSSSAPPRPRTMRRPSGVSAEDIFSLSLEVRLANPTRASSFAYRGSTKLVVRLRDTLQLVAGNQSRTARCRVVTHGQYGC